MSYLAKSSAGVFLFISVFQIVKYFLFPGMGIFYSHCLTVVFATLVSFAGGYFILINISQLHKKIEQKYEDAKKLEKALHLSEERFRLILDNAVDSLVLFDIGTEKLVDFNKNSCRCLGYGPEEFAEMDFSGFRRISEKFDVREIVNSVSSKRQVGQIEARFKSKDGSVRDVSMNASLMEVKGKKYLLLIWKEVTQAKKAEKNLVENSRLMTTLMETIPLPVFYKNKDGRYIGCNRAFEKFIGCTKNKILGKDVFEIGVPKDIAEKYFAKDLELLQNPGYQTYQWKVLSQSNGARDVVFHKATFNDFEGITAGIIGVILDVTEYRELREKSDSVKDLLLEQNRILVKWTNPDFMYSEDQSVVFREIMKTLSEVLDVERVSIWFYNDDFTKLRCLELFERTNGWSSSKDEIDISDYPSYFKHLKAERVIAADDVSTDFRTLELNATYVLSNRITSMMDIPLNVDGGNVGVLCCEHVGVKRRWPVEQQNFAIASAQLLSMILEISKRRELEKGKDDRSYTI